MSLLFRQGARLTNRPIRVEKGKEGREPTDKSADEPFLLLPPDFAGTASEGSFSLESSESIAA